MGADALDALDALDPTDVTTIVTTCATCDDRVSPGFDATIGRAGADDGPLRFRGVSPGRHVPEWAAQVPARRRGPPTTGSRS